VAVFDRQSNCEYGEQNLASTVSARDYKSPTDLVAVGVTGPISHALKAEGADASEDGTGRGTPIIAFTSINDGGDATNGMTPTLTCGGGGGQGVGMAITVALRGREGGATAELGGDVATALRASSGGGDKPHVLTYSQDHGSPIKPSEICPTLTKDGPSGSAGGNGADVLSLTSAVRRLTPRECERLQGFQFLVAPDYPKAWQDDAGRWWSPDYTAIPYNKVSEAKLDADWVKYMARGNPKNLTRADVARLAADGPRYKALGNSWAVPLFNWLGKRIASHMPALAANDNTKDSTSAAA
jgi:DNA (cytosine-5)-methyltransferase 1